MVGPRLKSRLIRYLPAASVKQVGSQLFYQFLPRRGYLTDTGLGLSRGRSLVNRWRSQEDEIYFERWERITYLIIKN